MAVWADLYPHIAGRLIGCPFPLLDLELRESAMRFFRESRVWLVRLETTVAANSDELELESDESSQQPVRIEMAWGNGTRLSVRTALDMDSRFADDWMTHTASAAETIVQMVPNIAKLHPKPTSAMTIALRMAVCPSETSNGFPSEFLRYKDAIIAGALWKLFSYEKEPWASKPMAAENYAISVSKTAEAARQAAKSFGRAHIASRTSWC